MTTFNSGMRLVTAYNENAKGSTINILVKTGLINETAKNNGISHLIEHMLFKGTSRRSAKQITEDFEKLGANVNAYTKTDCTCFYASALNENIGKCCEIFADMLYDSAFDPIELEREKKVVYEEIDMYEDDPGSVAFNVLQEDFFKGTYLERQIIGTKNILKTLTSRDLKEYVKKYYIAPNIIISIAGGIKHQAAINLVKKYFNVPFAGTECRPNVTTEDTQSIIKPKKAFSYKKKKINQTWIVLGFPAGGVYSDKRPVYTLSDFILGEGMSSRLFQEVREKLGLVYSIHSYTDLHNIGGCNLIMLGTNKDQAERAVSTIRKVLDDLKTNGITEEEYKKALTYKKTTLVFSEEISTTQARHNATYVALYNKPYNIEKMTAELNAVQKSDIDKAIQEVFDYSSMCGAIVSNSPEVAVFKAFN